MKKKSVYLAGGCYWGLDNLLSKVPGVTDTEVGFAGGHIKNVSYREVTTGETGHAETVKVNYDEDTLTYIDLLLHFFKMHDPTTHNQQGNDRGTQYRSAIFVSSKEQQLLTEALIKQIDAQGVWKNKILTEVKIFDAFYPAEDAHQKYIQKNPEGYTCHYVRNINFKNIIL